MYDSKVIKIPENSRNTGAEKSGYEKSGPQIPKNLRSGRSFQCLISPKPGLLCFSGLDVDELAAFFAFSEDNHTVDQCEQCVVLSHAYVETGVMNCTALTLDDVAGFAMLTTENLYSESFAF